MRATVEASGSNHGPISVFGRLPALLRDTGVTALWYTAEHQVCDIELRPVRTPQEPPPRRRLPVYTLKRNSTEFRWIRPSCDRGATSSASAGQSTDGGLASRVSLANHADSTTGSAAGAVALYGQASGD